MPHQPAAEKLSRLLKRVDESLNKIHQLVVVNTKSAYSLPDDYSGFSVSTEFLSDEELDQITRGFRDGGVFTEVIVGERQFCEYLTVPRRESSARIPLVYSTVPSGTWHGRDSLIPALCGAYGISYCGSDAYGMGVAGNKYYALRLAERCGQNTGGIGLYGAGLGWMNERVFEAGERIIVKPALECASIGIDAQSVRTVDTSLEPFLEQRATELRQPLLVQPFVPGYEIEVPVFGAPEPIAPAAFGLAGADGRKELGDLFFGYDQVYQGEYSYYRLSDEDPNLDRELRESATVIYRELGLRGFARIDYRVSVAGQWAVTDVNAVPHLTRESANHLAFSTLGLTYPEVLKLVTAAGLIIRRGSEMEP